MLSGFIVASNPTFGFIEQDVGGDNMFVIPSCCEAFGMGKMIPPKGTRVLYSVVADEKTGRPRAMDVQPESAPVAAFGGGNCAGTITKSTAQYGFIQQDSGGDNMFVIPSTCEAFGKQVPPVGTRVVYGVVADEKTGRPRADGVMPEGGAGPFAAAPAPTYGKACGAKGGGWGGGGKGGGGKGGWGRSQPY